DNEPEYRTDAREHSDLDEMLHEDLATARAERPAHARDRGAREELGEQDADRVDQADGEECQGDDDQHAVVVRNDIVVHEPGADVGDAIVTRSLESAGAMLIGPVRIDERLHALATRPVRKLGPHLQPHAIGVQEFAVSVEIEDLVPALDVAARVLLERREPSEGDVDILRFAERSSVEIVE